MTEQDLSYLLRESQRRLLADLMQPLLTDVMQHNYGYLPSTPGFVADNWLPDHQAWLWGDPSEASGIRYVRIAFDHTQLGWQDGSTVAYGPAHVVSDTTEIKPDLTYLIDNQKGVSDLRGELAESVTYDHSRTVTTDQQWHFDFGTSQKLTLGGKDAGIGFEATANEAFGWKLDTTQAEADSTNITRSQKLAYDVPLGKAELATLASPTVVTSQPLTLDAWWTMPFTIEVSGFWLQASWAVVNGPRTAVAGSGYGTATTRFLGWEDFDAFLRATNTEFPTHTNPWSPRTQFDPATGDLPKSGYTLLQMTGKVRSSEQSATEWKFTDVTGQDPSKLNVPDGHTIYASAHSPAGQSLAHFIDAVDDSPPVFPAGVEVSDDPSRDYPTGRRTP